MSDGTYTQLATVEAALAELARLGVEGRLVSEARQAAAELVCAVISHTFYRLDPLEVRPEHRDLAFRAVTAYLDGAERDDNFQLLSAVLEEAVRTSRARPGWVAAALAAFARVAGDLAVEAAGVGDGSGGFAEGMKVVARLAARAAEAESGSA